MNRTQIRRTPRRQLHHILKWVPTKWPTNQWQPIQFSMFASKYGDAFEIIICDLIAKHVKRRVDSNMDNNRQLLKDIEFPSFDA